MNEGLLSVKNASGRQVSLLNSNDEPQQHQPQQVQPLLRTPTSPTSFSSPEDWQQDTQQSKRKYHCIEPGCNKSFTTSGHLARHNRIHTGEKNFPCLFPGCQSRFSRQDNMMQHYRTHMSPKSRRSQKRGAAEEARPRPRLHAHHRIKSDPVRVEPPLTIDQHLSNYHQSLRSSPLSTSTTPNERHTPVRFNFPLPLSSTARSHSSNLKKTNINNNTSSSPITPVSNIQHTSEFSSPSPTLSHSSSTTSLPSIHHIIDDSNTNNHTNTANSIMSSSSTNNSNSNSRPTSPVNNINIATTTSDSPNLSPSNSSSTLFYQHRPLTFSRPQNPSFPYTLLHPVQQIEEQEDSNVVRNQSSGKYNNKEDGKDDPMDEDDKSPSSGGLLQLAHIVSTFG